MASALAPTAAREEHDRLVAEAREAGGWSGCVIASWAGVTAREAGLAIDCPFGPDEAELAEWWRRGFAQGSAARVPSATIHTLSRSRGATMAAHSAVND